MHMHFVSSLLPLLTINAPFAFLMVTKLKAGSPFFLELSVLIPHISFPEWLQPVQGPQLLMGIVCPLYIILHFRTLVFVCHFFTQFVWYLTVPSATWRVFLFLTFYSPEASGGCVHCSLFEITCKYPDQYQKHYRIPRKPPVRMNLLFISFVFYSL